MKKEIKDFIVSFFNYSGINTVVGEFLTEKIFCVGYHSIYKEANKDELMQKLYTNISISEDDFEKQLLFLKDNGHTFIHFSDLKEEKTKELSKPTIIFFDDGFKDVLVNALPILKKHGIPATIFITTGLVQRTNFLWTLNLRQFIPNAEEVIKWLKKLGRTERNKETAELSKKYNFEQNPSDMPVFLNWNEVVELYKNGFEIGSHGVSHERLVELSDEELSKEVSDSKKILEEKIGNKIEVISYPHGRYNEKVEEFSKKAGYSFGVSTEAGYNTFEDLTESPFRLKKIAAEPNEDLDRFKVRLYMNI